MKTGDLVKLCVISYPQYIGMCGIINIKAPGQFHPGGPIRVFINNRWHPYGVSSWNLEVISESCKQDE